MSNKIQQSHEIKFLQQSLEPHLRQASFGQKVTFKFLIVIITICLTVLSGCCAGMLYVFLNRAVLLNEEIGLLFGLGGMITVLVWSIEITRVQLAAAFWKAILIICIASTLIVIRYGNPILFFLFFFILFALIVTQLAFLGSLLSFQVLRIFFIQKKSYIKLFHIMTLVTSSIVTACFWSATTATIPTKFSFILNYYTSLNTLGGFGAGILIIFMTFKVSKISDIPTSKFAFFRSWAIALASWGGTSFYNLDLSGINFTGSKLAHTDFRSRNFYRTCLRDVKGLDRARVDNRYFDLDLPKVQELLTTGSSREDNFIRVNLRGAYLKDAVLRGFNLSEANLDGADLSGADLRDSILVRSILTSADLSRANLTGACIKDWSFNDETCLTGVVCDYVYREFDDRPTDRYPSDRNLQPGEFEALFQKLTNAVELVFQEQIDWRALSFTFEKFRLEDDGTGLELKGIEQRGDYWIVKVTHGEGVPKQLVEQQVHNTYGDIRALMEAKDKQINQLLGIVDNQTKAMHQQAEALTHFSQQPFGNNFFISGSTITNLAGSGQIEYREAADRVRSLVTNRADPNSTLQRLIDQLSDRNVATTSTAQQELIQQILISEAEQDTAFKQFLLQQGQQIVDSLPSGEMAIAVQAAIAQLRT